MGQQAKGRRRGIRYGDAYGWDHQGIRLSSDTYGQDAAMATARTQALEEAFRRNRYETNGLARIGNAAVGFLVRGRYVRAHTSRKPIRSRRNLTRQRVVFSFQQRTGIHVTLEVTNRLDIKNTRRTGVARYRTRKPFNALQVARRLVSERQGIRRRETRLAKLRARLLESSRLAHTRSLHGVTVILKRARSRIIGYKVTVKGTRNGSLRSKTIRLQFGSLPRSTHMVQIGLAYAQAKTTVGTFGVTVEYAYTL